MSRFSRLEVLNQIVDTALIPVFYHSNLETATNIIRACSEAGLKIIEFTNRGEQAHLVFSELVRNFMKEDPRLILGAGSIVDPYTAGLYIANGASFIVGPTCNLDVAKVCNRRKISYSPGCSTASEISNAEEMGVEIVKIFPGDTIGGPKFVKSILAPMPWVRIMPTGGVEATQESIQTWFNAGVAAVGIGSNLIRKDWVETKQWEKISELASNLLAWIQAAQGKPVFLGMDHVCLYPEPGGDGCDLVKWYQHVFELKADENPAGFFLTSTDSSRIEVSKVEHGLRPHIAIRTSDFTNAIQLLQEKGVEVDTPSISPNVKLAYLKNPDPAGNRVHIVWRKN